MGLDKAALCVGGLPLAGRVAAALALGGCRPVVLVGGPEGPRRQLADRIGVAFVPDRWPGAGPLGGTITALRHARDAPGSCRTGDRTAGLVVAACDLPALDGPTVSRFVADVGDRAIRPPAAVAVTDRPQPSLAWWSLDAVAGLEGLFQTGMRSLTGALDAVGAVEVAVPGSVLLNANFLGDLGR